MSIKRILSVLLAIFVMATPIYASIPDSVIMGNKAYDVRYIFNNSNYEEINTSLKAYPNNILYKLDGQTQGKIYNLSKKTPLTDNEIMALPDITFKDILGNEFLYGVENGDVVNEQPSPDSWFNFSRNDKSVVYGLTDEGKKQTRIVMPNSVTSITDYAFEGCKGLTTIKLSDSLTSIGRNAFYACDNLSSITIPNSVSSIGDRAFSECDSMESINVEPNNLYYCDVDGVLFNKNKTTLIAYPNKKPNSSYIIPDSVKSIAYESFGGCTGLKTVTIPNSVTSIGARAFALCAGLTTVKIPSSVNQIGYQPFGDCTDLISINVEPSNSCYSDIDGVLYNKNKTAIIAYPASKDGNFYTIPNSVTSIVMSAFDSSKVLKTISVPSSVTYIDTYAFYNCAALKSINVDSSNSNYSDMDGVLYNKAKTIILKYPTGRNDNSYTISNTATEIGESAFNGVSALNTIIIPDSVTKLDNYSFTDCYGLTSVVIPNSVTSIGYDVFWGCKSLTAITIPNSISRIGSGLFYGCTDLVTITIPDSVTYIDYDVFDECKSLTVKCNQFLWNKFKDRFPDGSTRLDP